ncbi:MAG: response regulator, partial [Steroidobacteraceae bacterium]
LLVAYSSDLSKGGMFLQTEQFLPVNAVVRVDLELGAGSAEIPVICRVVYVRDHVAARGAGKPAGMGIEFLDLSVDCLSLIEGYIAERIGVTDSVVQVAPARRLSIMIVDDDSGCRTMAAAPFRLRGDYVRVAPDGFEALAQCLKETPDVIVSDVQMPRMDGWQLVRMLRARPSLSQVPVVLFTTLADDDARLRGYRLGVDDYIAKPVREDELLVRVDRVVARTQQSTPLERRSLRGDLEHVALASLLSFLSMEQKTGVLLLVGAGTARIHLRGGQPLRVELDDIPVADAEDPMLFALLGWSRGQFEFAAQDVACADDLGTTVNALLIEHARRSDESSR